MNYAASRDGWDADETARKLWGNEIVKYDFDDDDDDGYMRRLEEKRQRRTMVPCVTCGAPAPKTRQTHRYVTCGPDCHRIFLGLYNHLPRHYRRVTYYVQPGSLADVIALEAYRRNLPIFQLLPEAIRDQIAGRAPRIRSYQHMRRLLNADTQGRHNEKTDGSP